LNPFPGGAAKTFIDKKNGGVYKPVRSSHKGCTGLFSRVLNFLHFHLAVRFSISLSSARQT
jgi:hypothetical protein